MISKQKTIKIGLGPILLIIGVLALAYVSYFMFITTLSSPTSMELIMPRDSEEDSVEKYDDTRTKLTLILLKDDKVFGYYGDFLKGGRSVSNSETDKLIEDGSKMFTKDSLVVVIKPTEEASYKATIDILNKMSINKIEKYSMTGLSKQEKEFLKTGE